MRATILPLAFALAACSAPTKSKDEATMNTQSSGGSDEATINTLPSGDQVYSEMWALARYAEELDDLMRAGNVDHGSAQTLLGRMESAANRLREQKQRAKHPLLDDNIDSFYKEISIARKAAEAEPPNYYYAGKVSGACVFCHDPDGGLKVH